MLVLINRLSKSHNPTKMDRNPTFIHTLNTKSRFTIGSCFFSNERWVRLLAMFGWLLLFGVPFVANANVLSTDTLSLNRLQQVAILEDKAGVWTLEDVKSPQLSSQFQLWPSARGQINLGFSKSAYWIRIPLQRSAQATGDWVLEVPFFQLQTVDFFAPGLAPIQTGGARDISTRPYLHRFFAFPIQVSEASEDFYLRVTSEHSLTVPLEVWQETAFRHHVQFTFILQALYFGAWLALLIYNLFLWISLKDVRFVLYTLFIANFGLAMLAGNGMGQMFLWPRQGAFDGLAQSFFLGWAGCFAMLFGDRFVHAKRFSPTSSKLLQIFSALYGCTSLVILASLQFSYSTVWAVIFLFSLSLPAGGLVAMTGFKGLKNGFKGIRFFLLAWLVLWAGALIAMLRAFDLLPTNTFTSYSLQIASAFEMLLLALALADIVHIERNNKEIAQKQALDAQVRLLENARMVEDKLERAVKDRTAELRQALQTETQILSQYMRFGALISHEFRNPLGIVNSQISLMRKEAEKGSLDLDKRLETIGSATRRLHSLFETWLNGDRLQQAMQAMTPQHLPLAAWLRELVDEQMGYHPNHIFELRIHQPIGDIWADENLLEVALLNLIDNACKYSAEGTTVAIDIHQKPGWIGICVTDQGRGIEAQHHQAVFDDYYRVVAESTISGLGLGLAFVKRIVQMHQGEYELRSVVNQGSSFCIWLPHQNQ
jgi:two-component system, sensor histidine kinase LadS